MSKIRRIRYGPHKKVRDTNPFIPEGEERYHWVNHEVIDTFAKADLRQLGDHGYWPGKHFQLRVPMTDPETGCDTDADGDTALLRIEMVGATMDFITGRISVKGFVSKQELANEAAYRVQDLDACLASYDDENAPDWEFVVEEWQVIG